MAVQICLKIVQIDRDEGDIIDEPKLGMKINTLDDSNSYYKQYTMQSDFGVTT